MDLLMVFLLDAFCFAESYNVLLLVKMLHFELCAKLENFFCLTFALGNFGHLIVKTFVQVLKILLLFSFSHEKKWRQLRVVSLESFSLLRREKLNVVSHAKPTFFLVFPIFLN